MPALSGQYLMTLPDGNGTILIVVTWFFNPATQALRDTTATWTSPTGKVWPAGSSLIADNQTGRTVSVVVNNPETGTHRTFSIPSSGRSLSAAQLAAVPPPNGPVTTSQDLGGLSVDLS